MSNRDAETPSGSSFYTPLPDYIKRDPAIVDAGPPPVDPLTRTFAPSFVKSQVPSQMGQDKHYYDKVHNKTVMLDNPLKSASETKQRNKNKRLLAQMSAKERRKTKIYEIPKEARNYDLFVPLHELWKGYVEELYGSGGAQAFAQKVVKMDFHGACLTVSKSKCPSYLGVSGIVVKETENIFQIITKKNQLKSIPKANNQFTFQVRDSIFTLHGNQFCYRAGDRSAKKFKSKPTVDL
ncbi:uncharacterized protein VTP21DRAFT_8724 [Calcarisporiella thermophila]|uniref:uncharacterized protein n=1 Tax=Calcarisporiella thermophila TaxID=911321 RepID=UPI0037441074